MSQQITQITSSNPTYLSDLFADGSGCYRHSDIHREGLQSKTQPGSASVAFAGKGRLHGQEC
jgi:hypothetical protein